MRSNKITTKLSTKIVALALVAAQFVSVTTAAQAQSLARYWTTVGSAGTVDEADAGKVVFNNGYVSMKNVLQPPSKVIAAQAAEAEEADQEPAGLASEGIRPDDQPSFLNAVIKPGLAETTSAVIRYNVTAVDGLFTTPDGSEAFGYTMRIRYRDNGGSAQVLVRLKELNMTTGIETVRLSFDSNQHPSHPGYQVQGVSTCFSNSPWQFDFANKAYYVEVTLIQTSGIAAISNGDPGLASIQIMGGAVCIS